MDTAPSILNAAHVVVVPQETDTKLAPTRTGLVHCPPSHVNAFPTKSTTTHAVALTQLIDRGAASRSMATGDDQRFFVLVIT
jgi:hypothetical protein